jgi:hypothetical protein
MSCLSSLVCARQLSFQETQEEINKADIIILLTWHNIIMHSISPFQLVNLNPQLQKYVHGFLFGQAIFNTMKHFPPFRSLARSLRVSLSLSLFPLPVGYTDYIIETLYDSDVTINNVFVNAVTVCITIKVCWKYTASWPGLDKQGCLSIENGQQVLDRGNHTTTTPLHIQ